MADGDPWKTNRMACVYQTDEGWNVRYRALERYQSQAALGWVACGATQCQPWGGSGLSHRKWLMWDAGDHSKRRSVVVATNAAYIAGVIGVTTLAVQNPVTDVEDTFTLYAMEGERKRGIEAD